MSNTAIIRSIGEAPIDNTPYVRQDGGWTAASSGGAASTDELPEGLTNFYYTEARVNSNSNVAANTAKVSFPEAPIDGQQYARQDEDWEVVKGDLKGISTYNYDFPGKVNVINVRGNNILHNISTGVEYIGLEIFNTGGGSDSITHTSTFYNPNSTNVSVTMTGVNVFEGSLTSPYICPPGYSSVRFESHGSVLKARQVETGGADPTAIHWDVNDEFGNAVYQQHVDQFDRVLIEDGSNGNSKANMFLTSIGGVRQAQTTLQFDGTNISHSINLSSENYEITIYESAPSAVDLIINFTFNSNVYRHGTIAFNNESSGDRTINLSGIDNFEGSLTSSYVAPTGHTVLRFDAFKDNIYARQVETGGGTGPATTDDLPEGTTNLYNRLPLGGDADQVLTKLSSIPDDIAWADAPAGGGISEAPTDGTVYVRQNADWVESANNSVITNYAQSIYVDIDATDTFTTLNSKIDAVGADLQGRTLLVRYSNETITLTSTSQEYLNFYKFYNGTVGIQGNSSTANARLTLVTDSNRGVQLPRANCNFKVFANSIAGNPSSRNSVLDFKPTAGGTFYGFFRGSGIRGNDRFDINMGWAETTSEIYGQITLNPTISLTDFYLIQGFSGDNITISNTFLHAFNIETGSSVSGDFYILTDIITQDYTMGLDLTMNNLLIDDYTNIFNDVSNSTNVWNQERPTKVFAKDLRDGTLSPYSITTGPGIMLVNLT